MNILFIDENGEHSRDGLCEACWYQAAYYNELCKCGGKFHSEFSEEYCTEDYSDCWIDFNYRCDKCNSDYPGNDSLENQ